MCQLDGAGNIISTQSQTGIKDILDGTSQTFLVGEKHSVRAQWGQSGPTWGEGSIWNGDFPRNFSRIAGQTKWNLGQGPTDLVGPWHCKFGSWHPGVCQFLFADGHVIALSNNLDMDTLQKLAVRNDGQVIPLPRSREACRAAPGRRIGSRFGPFEKQAGTDARLTSGHLRRVPAPARVQEGEPHDATTG